MIVLRARKICLFGLHYRNRREIEEEEIEKVNISGLAVLGDRIEVTVTAFIIF
jgi:hypothetical protein